MEVFHGGQLAKKYCSLSKRFEYHFQSNLVNGYDSATVRGIYCQRPILALDLWLAISRSMLRISCSSGFQSLQIFVGFQLPVTAVAVFGLCHCEETVIP